MYIIGAVTVFKKIACTIFILFFSLSLIACEKQADLNSQEEGYIRSLVDLAVKSEVMEKYGYVPAVIIDKIKASDRTDDGFYYRTFTAEGSYTVRDDNDVTYEGHYKVNGHIESHGEGWDSCDLTAPKNGMSVLPEIVKETVPTTQATTIETTVLTLSSGEMIRLSEQYSSEGYMITVFDPSGELDQCYGALECFRAYNKNTLFVVYLYDSAEAAENAEYNMFGNREGTLQSVDADTSIVNDRILIAEYHK